MNVDSDLRCTCTGRSTRRDSDSPFPRPFFKVQGHGDGAFVCASDQDLALTVRIDPRFESQVCSSWALGAILDSGLHVADAVTEAPAARDVDASDAAAAAPLVTVTWQWQQRAVWRQLGVETWMPREHAQRLGAPGPLPQWSGYVMPLALVSGIKEAEPHLAKQLLYSGIVKDLGIT